MWEALLKGLALGIALSISVGPVIFTILKQSLVNGHRGGFIFIAGVSISDIALVLVCNLFSDLFDLALQYKQILGGVGSAFLIGMGAYNLFFKKIVADTAQVQKIQLAGKQSVRIFLSGFFMNTLNPGAFLFWFVACAALISDAAVKTHPIAYKWVAFSSCLAFVLAMDIVKVLLAGKIRSKLTPKTLQIITQISGAILVIFGIALLFGMGSHQP